MTRSAAIFASLLLVACATGGPGASDAGGRFAPGSDAGPGSNGGCGSAGNPCCMGFCNDGLTCNPTADVCEASGCGAEGQDCCGEGPRCQGTLTCVVSGVCVQEGSADGGIPASGCGMRGAACCAADPPCGSGLACNGGVCQDAPACGAVGQACCVGSACNAGLMCAAGLCQSNPTPTCVADGGSCAANADCCNNSCISGTCQPPATSTMPPCNTYATCGTCTDTPHCMWCGTCVDYEPLTGLLCAVFPDEC